MADETDSKIRATDSTRIAWQVCLIRLILDKNK